MVADEVGFISMAQVYANLCQTDAILIVDDVVEEDGDGI